jgi:hypothetical protein
MILLGEEGKDSSGLGAVHPFGLWNSTDPAKRFMLQRIRRCFGLQQPLEDR